VKSKLAIILSFTLTVPAHAGSATWNLNPATNDWNTATNWTPVTVPNATTDTATFGASNTTSVSISDEVDLASLVFAAAAPSYTFDTGRLTLTFWGDGVRNDSGVQQTFTGRYTFNENSSAGDGVFTSANIVFNDNSTAANGTFTTGRSGGSVEFFGGSAGSATFTLSAIGGVALNMLGGTLSNATVTVNGGNSFADTLVKIQFSGTADHATLIANGGATPGEKIGKIIFLLNSTAAESTLIANPAKVAGPSGGSIQISNGATASDSNITVNGATVTGDGAQGVLTFTQGNTATAANATIVATGGFNGGKGGLVQFLPNAKGGACRIELLGNSQLDMAADRDLDLTIGSLEGEGTVTLGGHALIIGSNNLGTIFSGLIQDGTGVGAVAKTGTGTLTLGGANTYTGDTTISSGILLVSNISGSGTGTGAVSVTGGTLGGSGIIAGAVTVGTNSGTGAFLSPSKGAKKPATLTIQSALTLNDDSTYVYKLDTKRARADEVIANGVVIDSGAKFSFRPSGNNALTVGQVFSAINNTATTAIGGTFHNLPEGKILIVNGSNLQASYSGGDGNDLTLTVVP